METCSKLLQTLYPQTLGVRILLWSLIYRLRDLLVDMYQMSTRNEKSMLKTLSKIFNTNLLWPSLGKLIQGHYLNHRVKLVTDWVTGERNTFWNVEQRTCQIRHYTGHTEAFPICPFKHENRTINID